MPPISKPEPPEQVTNQHDRESNSPPRYALKVFRWYCGAERLEELEGDLEELYFLRLRRGDSKLKADAFYWWNVVRCFKPYTKSNSKKSSIMTALIKSYLTLALRHSWKNKGPVGINVIGLGLALSMCLFVYMLYAYNLEFDSFYKNTDDIYRLHAITVQNDEARRNEISPVALDDKLRNEISGIQQLSSFFTKEITVKKSMDHFTESAGIVSEDFLEMFDIPLWYGSTQQFGQRPVVFLTKPLAIKYFGDEIALGERLMLTLPGDNKLEVFVGGVFDNIPLNSSFRFDILVSENDYFRTIDLDPKDWANGQFTGHYLSTTAQQVEQITDAINLQVPLHNEKHRELQIERFELVHFPSPLPNDLIKAARFVNRRMRSEGLIIFTTLSIMVFLTACFNLANTSMALISKRLKEIGIRRTLGSGSRHVLLQFLIEMGMVSAFAFVIAITSAHFALKTLASQLGVSFMLSDIEFSGIVMFVASFLVITTLASGLLPALYAWKFQPISIMRKAVKLKGVTWLNKLLTSAQYAFTIAVLATGITFSQNADFLNAMDIGYQDDLIIDLPMKNKYIKPIQRELDQIPNVLTAGAANHLGNFGKYSERVSLQMDTSFQEVRYYAVGPAYLDLMEVNIVSGRGFLKASTADESKVLVNQEFVRQYFEGQNPINEVIKLSGRRKTIVGVTEDIIDDVVKAAELIPTVVGLSHAENFQHIVVKVPHGNLESVEEQVKSIWREHIDEPYAGFRQKDFALGAAGDDAKTLHSIFIVMAVLSGFLSIAGIFSLAKLNVVKRLKEISIRKVLGASMGSLISTINRPFATVLLAATVLGSILGYVITNAILDMMYRYHVEASMVTGIVCAISVIGLSLIMIAGAAIVPIKSNPVQGLRED